MDGLDKLRIALRSDVGKALARYLFDVSTTKQLAKRLDTICIDTLGAGVVDVLYARPSVALPLGVLLSDGRKAALKFHRVDSSNVRGLEAINAIQYSLIRRGIPCPEPLAPVQTIDRAVVTFDSFLSLPKTVDARRSINRSGLATGLANFVQAATSTSAGRKSREHLRDRWVLGDPARPFACFEGPRWRLGPTERKAGFLNELGADGIAQAEKVHTRNVIGHFDWRIENVRLRSGHVHAIIDMDSTAAAPEMEVVGVAAAIHTVNHEGVRAEPPSPILVSSFIDMYAEARGRPFSQRQREGIAGVVLWTLAGVARRELMRDPYGKEADRGCRAVLARYGHDYLST